MPRATRDSAAAANNIVTAQDLQMAILSLIHAVQPCLKNGWTQYKTSNGIVFKNVLECAIYAALGGHLVLIPPAVQAPPVIVSFTYDGLTFDPSVGAVALFTPTFTGGTGTITIPSGTTAPVTSGVQVEYAVADGVYTLTVTNSGGSVTGTQILSGTSGSVGGADSGPTANKRPGDAGKFTP